MSREEGINSGNKCIRRRKMRRRKRGDVG